jgi:hypothetical protein
MEEEEVGATVAMEDMIIMEDQSTDRAKRKKRQMRTMLTIMVIQ